MPGGAHSPNVSAGRSKELPAIEKVKTHPKVKERRPIYVVKGFEEDGWMKAVLDNVAPKKCPKDRADAVKQGYVLINAADSPVILWRNMAGTQRPEDDKIVVWTRPGKSIPRKEAAFMRNVRNRILGPRADVGAGKAQFDSATGEYTGGVAFERNDMAVSLVDTNRAYPLATSHQSSRGMNAPHRGRKNFGMPLDEHGELVRDIQKVGVIAGMAGLADGPEGLKDLMDERAEYLNVPRVGDQVNSAFPTLQMNLASAAEPDEEIELSASLGTFGSSHPDCGDSAYLFIMDFGIGIILNEFDTTFFCGLRFHGGTQPRYARSRSRRTNGCVHVRITLIAYGPAGYFDAPASEAFIAVPSKEGVLKVFRESKDWIQHLPFERSSAAQATYTSDGESIMDPVSNFDYFARNCLQIIANAVEQYPQYRLARVDKDVFLSSLTFVHNGERTAASPWPLGPGWSGDDTKVGNRYDVDPRTLDPAALQRIHNTDAGSDYLYNNKAAHDHSVKWRDHHAAMTKTIPLCVASDYNLEKVLEVKPIKRRSVTKSIRSGKAISTVKPIKSGKVSAKMKKKTNPTETATEVRPTKKLRRRTAKHTAAGAVAAPDDATVTAATPPTAVEPALLTSVPSTSSNILVLSCDTLADALTVESLEAVVADLAAHAQVAIAISDAFDPSNLPQELETHLRDNRIDRAWSMSRELEAGVSSHTIRMVTSRGQSLQVACACWSWLAETMKNAYQSMKDGSPFWLSTLALKVHHLYTTSSIDTLDAADYLPHVKQGELQYTTAAIPYQGRIDSEVNFTSALRPILLKWFRFPSDIKDIVRGSFLQFLVQKFGHGVLYVPVVWGIHEHIVSAVSPKHRKLSNRNATIWLEDVAARFDGSMYDGVEERVELLAGVIAKYAKISMEYDVVNEIVLGRHQGASLLHAPSAQAMQTSTDLWYDEEAMAIFIDQIERLFPLIDLAGFPPIKPPVQSDKKSKATYAYLNMVFQNSDKKLPFRDLAESRRTILAPTGPYSPTNLRTRAGFFSAIVYRAITHHSKFLTEAHEIMFTNLDHFKQRVATYQSKPASYVCDPSAYGAWTVMSPENAGSFWRATGKSSLSNWLLGEEEKRFVDLMKMFIDSSDLPSVGPLIGYLLAADYAIAGAVPLPSTEEMGQIIFRIDKGGMSGMNSLGYLCRTEEETGKAFTALWEKMLICIPQERRDAMNFNVFVLEHMLCLFCAQLCKILCIHLQHVTLPRKISYSVHEGMRSQWDTGNQAGVSTESPSPSMTMAAIKISTLQHHSR
ncbi:hypothetical protein DFP72DRAFT_1059348 [Ephemerocybe angulata]|uniref:Uncharacterized protein n=1 Tax=Ephemerocybe angulata TaxID=980116 RepID=A0A8H6IH95_9AGAR|nr:hypothetical protein DFP72DRAFT_1059348 [Tulosesus angulatus]